MELKNTHPDKRVLNELQALFEEVHAINDEPDNFKSARRMREIINKYAPMLRAVYDAT